ncbi:MAG: endo-1,4-beta-xylanase [Treponema sp.]|nr:endo-1,4-beta-xylanase [Candidatus Treponema merdequi]
MADLSHRKAKAKIQILNKDGTPKAKTKINVNQINHEFLFGCGAFHTLDYVDGKYDDDRLNKWLNLFNYGTLPFYWGTYEPQEGKPISDVMMRAAKFLKEKDVKVKGHPLCWHTVCAPWLMKYDNETIFNKQIERIHRDVGLFKGVIDMWDVINEVVIMPIYDKYDNAVTRICKEKSRVGLVKEVFKAAYETNPDGTFLINDFNLSTNYEILIDGCLNAGVPINTIGLQSHQHQGIWGKQKQDETLERFEHFGLPIHFTENTIVAGPLVAPEITDLQDAHYEDDASTPEYEEIQADALEQQYRNLFENHPLVTAITNWDYTDGAWLNAPSGLIRRDGSLKPAYTRLHKLIKEEWHTELDLITDENGFVEVEGFKGKYELSDGISKAEFTLKSGLDSSVSIKL